MSKRTERRGPRHPPKSGGTNWKRGCHSKKRYHSVDLAKRIRRACERKRPGTDLRIYECHHCGGFHLTHVRAQREAVTA